MYSIASVEQKKSQYRFNKSLKQFNLNCSIEEVCRFSIINIYKWYEIYISNFIDKVAKYRVDQSQLPVLSNISDGFITQ